MGFLLLLLLSSSWIPASPLLFLVLIASFVSLPSSSSVIVDGWEFSLLFGLSLPPHPAPIFISSLSLFNIGSDYAGNAGLLTYSLFHQCIQIYFVQFKLLTGIQGTAVLVLFAQSKVEALKRSTLPCPWHLLSILKRARNRRRYKWMFSVVPVAARYFFFHLCILQGITFKSFPTCSSFCISAVF